MMLQPYHFSLLFIAIWRFLHKRYIQPILLRAGQIEFIVIKGRILVRYVHSTSEGSKYPNA